MILIEDRGQQTGKHDLKWNYWLKNQVPVIRQPLPVGDYILMNNRVADVIARKQKRGIDPKKMDFMGTYTVCVDTKFDIQELISDICGKQHDRFRDECQLAQNNGIKLFILVENKGGLIQGTDIINPTIDRLENLHQWKNPRLFIKKRTNVQIGMLANGKPKYQWIQKYPSATKGITLQKACYTMEQKYGVKFLFCHPSEAGKKVLEILSKEGGLDDA